ncbi:MAG: hypothetical protein MK214_15030 [Thalassotalea sp.]|nr:hypothetical protein [Thalassotalea sp.]
MSEPKSFISGTKVIWSRDYTGSETAIYEYILMSEQHKHTIPATYLMGEIIVAINSAESAALNADHYHWFLIETSEGEKFQIAEGRIEVKANPFTSETTTVLSHNEKMLTSIRKRLEGRVLTDHENYTIEGRSLSRIPFETLKKLENDYAWRVHNEKVARGEAVRRSSIRFR